MKNIRYTLITVMMSLLFAFTPSNSSAGTYHSVWGALQNSDASTPVNGTVNFTAYIQTRPGEIITQDNATSYYQDGFWGLDLSELETGFANEDVLIVNFKNTANQQVKQVQKVMNSQVGNQKEDVKLEMPALLSIAITPVDPIITVPGTEQFKAMGTFEGVANPVDITNTVTWDSSDEDKGTIPAGLFTGNYIGTTDITATQSSVTSNTSTVTVLVGPADAIAYLSGDAQTKTVGTAIDNPFVVKVTDEKGNPVGATAVTFAVTTGDGTISIENATTDTNGTASSILTLGIIAGANTVTATSVGLADSPITFNATGIAGAVSASQSMIEAITPIVADGVATSTITITAKDQYANAIQGKAATVSSTGSNNTLSDPANTSVAGETTATLASTKAETKTVSVSIDGVAITDTAEVVFNAGLAVKMTLDASKSTLASDGKGSAVLTATILDAFGNLVDDDTTKVTFAFTDYTYLTLAAPATVTATDGKAELTVTTAAGEVDPSPSATNVSIISNPSFTTPDPVSLNIVNFSVTPQNVALVTSGMPHQTTITAIGATNYTWSTTSGNGELSATSGETVTFTAPTSITESATGHETVVHVVDADNTDVIFDLPITTYEPVSITSPASAVGIALGDTTQGVAATGGTGTYKFQSNNTDVATVDADGGGITPVAAGTCQIQVRDATFGDFGTENGFYAISQQIEIVNPIIVDPATKSLNVSGSQTFAASGGKTGGYAWTCDNADAGIINTTTGAFTAAAVTVMQTATITATDGYDIKGTATVAVYPALAIIDKPSTPPMVLAGKSSQISVAGGDDNYTWTVTGPAGPVEGEDNEDATFTFQAPDTGAFAGKYTITVEDSEGFTDFTNIYVPLVFTPFSWNINGGDSFSLVVSGADIGAQITVGEFIDSKGGIIPDESTDEYATIDPELNDVTSIFDEESKVTFTVICPTDLKELKMFGLRVTVGGDDGLTDNGLDTATSGLYRVLPVVEYSGIVQDENGDVIEGADVQFKIGGEVKGDAVTDADGLFEVADLLSTSMISAEYDVIVTANGKLTVNLTTAGWSGERTEPIELIAQSDTITGSVKKLSDSTSIAEALVECIVNDVKYTTYSVADGSYALPLPVTLDELPEGTKVRVSKTDYAAKSLPVAETINFDLKTLTTVEGKVAVGADGGSFSSGTCTVELQEDSVAAESNVAVDANVVIGDDSDYTKYSTQLVEINIKDPASGDKVVLTQPIKLTIEFDTTNVNPGDFKNGNVVIYHAPTADDLRNGTNLKSVLPSDIVYEDHIGKSVCFWVNSLSVFGIGVSAVSSEDGTSLSNTDSDSRCFIATSAYGSPFESHVKILRNFRDVYLLPTGLGHAFVDIYYRYSPKAAAFIADHESLKAVVRVGLMPVVGISYVALHTTAAQKALIIFFMFSLLSGSCLAIRRLKARKTVTA